MTKFTHKSLLILKLCLFWILSSLVTAESLIAPECEVLEEPEEVESFQAVYGRGLLWKISKPGIADSHIFGTIHVADEAIVNLPAEIENVLEQADIFVMEVVPDESEIMHFASLMYFNNGQKLSDFLSRELFTEVVRLLSAYHLSEEAVVLLKPWAAFLTMSYPPEFGQILDMNLLEKARENEAEIIGLETLREQIEIFNSMLLDNQVKILGDTACHYEVVESDFEKMKALYLDRDLAGLYAYSRRYSLSDDQLYLDLIQKLLVNRNYIMTERMQSALDKGRAFIAIGAMHLPGDEGVLALLTKNGYEISTVY